MTDTQYPITLTKGEASAVAHTPSEDVSLRFEGYLPVAGPAKAGDDGISYRELQEQAKDLGIPASGTADELENAILAELERAEAEGEDA